jgi:hypothetical protein
MRASESAEVCAVAVCKFANAKAMMVLLNNDKVIVVLSLLGYKGRKGE